VAVLEKKKQTTFGVKNPYFYFNLEVIQEDKILVKHKSYSY
jgi:hypothetical protein